MMVHIRCVHQKQRMAYCEIFTIVDAGFFWACTDYRGWYLLLKKIVVEQMAKPTSVWPLGIIGPPWHKTVGFCLLVRVAIAPVSKTLAVKSFMNTFYMLTHSARLDCANKTPNSHLICFRKGLLSKILSTFKRFYLQNTETYFCRHRLIWLDQIYYETLRVFYRFNTKLCQKT